MAKEYPSLDHLSEAFHKALKKFPPDLVISEKKAKSDIRKYVARTDPQLADRSVKERRRSIDWKNVSPQIVILIPKE